MDSGDNSEQTGSAATTKNGKHSGGGSFDLYGGHDLSAAAIAELEAVTEKTLEQEALGQEPIGQREPALWEGFDHPKLPSNPPAGAVDVKPAALTQPPPPPKGAAQTPPATVSWGATNVQYGFPSDSQVAVSTSHVVVSGRQRLGYFDKAGNVVKAAFHAKEFFKPLGLDDGTLSGITSYNDLRLIFDGYRKRFWVVCMGGNPQQTDKTKLRSVICLGVSKTQNPMDGWYLYWWYAVAHWGAQNDPVYQPGDVCDYPCVGVDPKHIHVTISVSNAVSNSYRYWHVQFAPADPMAAGGPPPGGWQWWDLKNPDGSIAGLIQPALHHGASGRSYYISRYKTNKVLVWALTDPLTANQQLNRVEVTVAPFQSPLNAPQKGSAKAIKMTNLGTNPIKAVFRWPYMYAVFNDARDWFGDGQTLTSVRLLRMSVAGFPNIPTTTNTGFFDRTFGKNSTIDDPSTAHIHYGWPAVEVNKDGDAVVVYARTGSTLYPEVRITEFAHDDTDIRPSRLLKVGVAAYDYTGAVSPLPWGDTGGASVDPSNDTGVWVAQQYATAPGPKYNYEIWVGRVLS